MKGVLYSFQQKVECPFFGATSWTTDADRPQNLNWDQNLFFSKYLFKNNIENHHYLFSATNGTNEHELFVSIGVISGKKFDNLFRITNFWNHFYTVSKPFPNFLFKLFVSSLNYADLQQLCLLTLSVTRH